MKVFLALTVEIESVDEAFSPEKNELTATAREAVVNALKHAEEEGFSHRHADSTSIHIDQKDVQVVGVE